MDNLNTALQSVDATLQMTLVSIKQAEALVAPARLYNMDEAQVIELADGRVIVVHSKPTMNIGIYLNIQVVRDTFPSRVLSLIEAQQGSVMRQTISADPEKVFTKAELVILYLVSRGLSNYEVASRVGLAESTVKNKLSDMYKRLKVRSRAEAVAYGVGIGLLKVLDRTDPTATSAAEVVEAFLHGGPEVLR